MAANTKEIKRRIKSISSTLQVTGALELVSSVKMRKASQLTLQSRDFSGGVWQLINELRASAGDTLPKLFVPNNNTDKILLIVIASDKGLAGSYNANVLRAAAQYIKTNNTDTEVITIGKVATKILGYAPNVKIVSSFEHSGEGFDFFEASPVSKLVLDSFIQGKYNRIAVAYTDFVNTIKQVAVVKNILPIQDNQIEQEENQREADVTQYKYEPDRKSILQMLGRLAVRSQIYQALLEAAASEHAARMVAMKNATENGNELVSDLKFSFNKLRQQSITQEIAEISAGRIALAK